MLFSLFVSCVFAPIPFDKFAGCLRLVFHPHPCLDNVCFGQFFNYARSASKLLAKFAVVHIDAPGQKPGSDNVAEDVPWFDMDVSICFIQISYFLQQSKQI